MSPRHPVAGFSLPELVMAMAVLGLLTTMALVHAGPDPGRQTLDRAVQSFVLALDRARLMSRRHHQACGLALEPLTGELGTGSGLPSCVAAGSPLSVQRSASAVQIHTNLPQQLRFSANGLLLDGGLVVFRHASSGHRPCVVVSLPLGVTRQGRYGLDPADVLNSQHCLPSQ